MLPARTTGPQGPSPNGEDAPAPPAEADAAALDQAALRLRPSWDAVGGDDGDDGPPAGWAGSAPEVAAPAVPGPAAPAPVPAAAAPAPAIEAPPVVAAAPVESERPRAKTAPSVDGAATIIVNEPGVIVLDAPPEEFRVRPEPEAPEMGPVVWDSSKGPDLLAGGGGSSVMQPTYKLDAIELAEDTDFRPPLTSRRPLLWVAGGALLGAVVLIFALRSGDAAKPTSAAPLVTETAAAPAPEAPAPEAPVVAAPAAPAEPVAVAEPEPAPAAAAPVEPPKPAVAKRGRHGRVSGPARVAKAERVEKAAPAPKPVAIRPAGTKKARKGAGFVSTNPYGP